MAAIEISEVRREDHEQVAALWSSQGDADPAAPSPSRLSSASMSHLSVVARAEDRVAGVVLCERVDGTCHQCVCTAEQDDAELTRRLVGSAVRKLRSLSFNTCHLHFFANQNERFWDLVRWRPDADIDPATSA
ncbi:MAG: hypothetical protein CMJ18_15060 [Phycisphaeraceae bacterium]|nr:hypothetical protein [Phycisphaeraceae bacterium]